ncbi:MAG: hypothetical protein NVS4B3_06890 [Gemmatimonadaceae bacterium]
MLLDLARSLAPANGSADAAPPAPGAVVKAHADVAALRLLDDVDGGDSPYRD